MNIEQISIDTYISMAEDDKIKFYRSILDELPKASITTLYETADKIAPQARIPQFLQHQIDGKLTYIAPLRRVDKKVTSLFFLCVCDCGNWVILEGKAYRQNRQTSCNKCSSNYGKFIKNIKGLVFGQLQAIEVTDKRSKDGSVYWLCDCIDCGHRQEVRLQHLQQPNGHLCEVCGSPSKGEYMVAQLLKLNQIKFQKEYTFEDCIYPFSQRMAKFDFYVNNEYIIEIDGEHHFKPTRYGKSISTEKAKENFIKQQFRDNYKNYFCFSNNIPIIRIPYTYLNKSLLKLEDLLPTTSRFLLRSEDSITEKGKNFIIED